LFCPEGDVSASLYLLLCLMFEAGFLDEFCHLIYQWQIILKHFHINTL